MANDVRALTVKWLGDASNLVASSKKAATAVGNGAKEITGHANKIGGTFGNLGKILGTFHLPFTGAAKTVSSELGNLESAGIGVGGAVGAGAAVAGAAMVEFARESIGAAEDFNKAHERLKVVVDNVGESIKGEANKITDTDNKLGQLGFTSTDTETALSKLVPVTKDVGKATTLLNVAADIARARNISLQDATNLLVQVEGGRMRGLQKLGIATKDVNGKTITAAQAMVLLNNQFGGAASQYAQTYAGKLAVMKSETNDLKVAIGNQLLPVLSDFAGSVAALLNGVDTVGQKLHVNFGRIAEDVGSLGLAELARKGLSEIHHSGDEAAKTMKDLQTATRAYSDDLARGDKTSQKAKQDQEAYTEANKKAKAINDGLAKAATTTSAAISDQNAKTKDAKKAAEDEAKAQQTMTNAILGTHDASIAMSNSVLGVSDSLDTYTQKAKDAATWGGKNASANRDWERASNDVKSSIDNVAASADNQAQKQHELHNQTYGARDSADAQRNALEKLRTTIAPGNPFRAYLDGLIRDLDRAATPRHGSLDVQVIGHTQTGQAIIFHPKNGTVNIPGTNAVMFAEGGTVPGPIGAPVPAIVHGGEVVTRAQDVSHMNGGATHNYSININVAPGGNPADVGRVVVASIRAYERKNGTGWRN